MSDPSSVFSIAFDERFRTNTKGLSHKEIPLFRKFHETLASLSDAFHIEEYHGSGHQVTFIGDGLYARRQAQCELSDLMIIVYSSFSSHIRLSYLQAKSERNSLAFVSKNGFTANLEQWFLLSTRPTIKGGRTFNPPPELLSGAILPSVGSFAFFFKNSAGDFQTYYASASHLAPVSQSAKRYGKVQPKGTGSISVTSGYEECLVACDNRSLAKSLYSLQIGTPIDQNVPQSYDTRNWLAANLRRLRPTEVTRNLIDLLKPETNDVQYGSFGARKIIILKSNFRKQNT